jgi:perosamine synthetase
LPREYPGNWHTWHLYVIRLRPERLTVGRDEFIRALRAENIGTSVHFIPVHQHPFFQPYLREGDTFPRADDYYARCISLPIFPDMSEDDVRDVAAAVTRLASHFARA